MAETITPKNKSDIVNAVQWVLSEEATLEVIGEGSKRALGRPMQVSHTLDLSNISGITLYEPEELVLSAKAGTPLTEIKAELAKNKQELQFEPMDYGPLLGEKPGKGTIGGVLATNLSGPRRLKAGAARDHILGIEAVSGRGELFKSGGRVMKNVTGYDLSKAMAGSWGTLAAFTDVTFKVLPVAETEATLVLEGLIDEDACKAMAVAMGSSAEVSGAAHLPEGVSTRFTVKPANGDAATLLRLEGFAPSVDYRGKKLAELLKGFCKTSLLDEEQSRNLWQEVRDVQPFTGNIDKPLWRLSVTPFDAHKILLALRMQTPVDAYYDWQGGLIWLEMQGEAEADLVREVIKQHGGGHATLIRANENIRNTVPPFQPQDEALAALSRRLKENFDPNKVLNPGRMVEGV
jgi:glycolate oxidase FAD binding subunit